jgi:hypothetical protein
MQELFEQIHTALRRLVETQSSAIIYVQNTNISADWGFPKQIFVVPVETQWVRTSRGHVRRELTVDIIFVAKTDDVNVDDMDGVLNKIATGFLNNAIDESDADVGGIFEGYTCMGVTTLNQAGAGFILETLTKTPSIYLGGLRVTFWNSY